MDEKEKTSFTADELEKERKRDLFLMVLYIVLGSLIVVGGFFMILFGTIAFGNAGMPLAFGGMGMFFLGSSVFSLLAVNAAHRYGKAVYGTFAPALAKEKFENYSFSFEELDSQTLSLVKPKSKRPFNSDCSSAKGTLRLMPFKAVYYQFMKPGKGHPDPGYGVWLSFTCVNPTDIPFIIHQHQSPDFFRDETCKTKIPTESAAFDAAFDAWVPSREVGYRVVTPQVIDGLNFLSEQYHAHPNVYAQEYQVWVYLDDYKGHFDLKLTKPVTESSLEALKNEILIPYFVAYSLNLL
jgi:uncharacterized membrane protein (DUF485 family)